MAAFDFLIRWFTTGVTRDRAQTIALYNEAKARFDACPLAKPGAQKALLADILHDGSYDIRGDPSQFLCDALDHLIRELFADGWDLFSFPEIDWETTTLSMLEEFELRKTLRRQAESLEKAGQIAETLRSTLVSLYAGIAEYCLAVRNPDEGAMFQIPLFQLAEAPHELVQRIFDTIVDSDSFGHGVFQHTQRRLYTNVCAASEQDPLDANGNRFIKAGNSKLSPSELIDQYLGGTAFHDFFLTSVPFAIDIHTRLQHWHLVGGSGHGKTQLLQHVILSDLRSRTPPALIVLDSQGDMLKKLQQLLHFAPGFGEDEKLIIIDPEDDQPPALNLFDVAETRLGGYSRLVREQVHSGIIELYTYIFSALSADLTSKQTTAFAFVARLMLSIEGATVHTLRELMEDGARSLKESKFKDAVAKLDPTGQAFFENQFFTSQFSDTRQQIARRLYGVLQVPAFERMFSAKRNRLDMFSAMQSGSVVLVNTAKALLKKDASALFGRYIIAQALAAAFERVAIPEEERKPAFLVVDEAAEYFDGTLETLLGQARKYKLGVLFAHQHMEQLTPALRAAVAANTAIKMAGGVSAHDARLLASDMRTTPEFLLGMRKRHHGAEWACYVRNHTDGAVRLEVPFGTLEKEKRMHRLAHGHLLELNREKVAWSEDDVQAPDDRVAVPAAPNKAATKPIDPDRVNTAPSTDW